MSVHQQLDQRDEQFFNRQMAMLKREMGSEIFECLKDPDVENICLNGPTTVFGSIEEGLVGKSS